MRWLKRICIAVLGLVALSYVGSSVYAYLPHEERPRAAFVTDGDQFVEVEGHQIRYRRWGKRPGKPGFLLLHGFAGSLNAFSRLGPLLADKLDVVAIDQMPFGLSDKPDDYEYSYENQARLAMKVAEALELRSLIIGGHSYGGTVAAYAAASDPRVEKLVLIDPGIHATGIPPFVKYMVFPLQRMSAKFFSTRGFRSKLLTKSFIDPQHVTPAFVDEIMVSTQMEGYMDGTTRLFMGDPTVDVDGVVPRITQPSMLIWGESDRNNPPSNAARLQKMIPGSEVRVVQRSGHYPMVEQPEVVAETILRFAGVDRGVDVAKADMDGQSPGATVRDGAPDVELLRPVSERRASPEAQAAVEGGAP